MPVASTHNVCNWSFKIDPEHVGSLETRLPHQNDLVEVTLMVILVT